MTTNRRHKAAVRARQDATGEPYSVASRQVRTLAEVMDEQPTLGAAGFGGRRSTPAELADRDELRGSAPGVDEVREWLLANLAPSRTPTESSYALKHDAERALGRYVPNGELIAAALTAGYPISRPGDGPNVNVAVSRRDPADRPRCSSCWSPLRRDSAGRWVNDEPVSKATCMVDRPHDPMDADERRRWADANRKSPR